MRTLLPSRPLAILLTVAAFCAAAPPAAASIDPNALAALKRMSATLATAPALSYRANTIFEVPASNGQFITLFSEGKVTLKRPDKLHAALRGSAPHFDLFYNGTRVSAYAPGIEVYSTQAAPPTIDAMLAGLQTETGIRFASAPLLTSNPYAALTTGLTSAIFVGPSRVDGVTCDHLAFRGTGVNWEIWLESNARALPRRIAVTFTDRTNFPRTVVELSNWNLNPLFVGGQNFTFKPPAGAREVPFGSVMKSVDR